MKLLANQVCHNCGEEATAHAHTKDWCNPCLAEIERDMSDFERRASKEAQAIADELGRLANARSLKNRGNPAEL